VVHSQHPIQYFIPIRRVLVQYIKLIALAIANIDGAANADFDLILNNAGSNTFIIRTVVVPGDATLVAVDKNSGFYLLENSTIGGAASANNDLSYVISLEQIYAS
jgi:hypothetical protein